MNWICPLCGNDNYEESIRCSCGYILEENNLSTIQWVQLQKKVSPPSDLLQPSLAISKTNKQKTGQFLYKLAIVTLLSFVFLVMITSWFPSKRITALILSTAICISTYSSLLTDDIGIRGVGAVKRLDNPTNYWGQFIFQSIMAVAFLLVAIFINE